MNKIIGRTFRNEQINLDFTDWEKCTFINCTIHVNYGIFSAKDCDFMNCKKNLGFPASNIARLIKLFHPDMPLWFEGEETREEVLQRMKERLEKEHII